jgi:hypothetical protein
MEKENILLSKTSEYIIMAWDKGYRVDEIGNIIGTKNQLLKGSISTQSDGYQKRVFSVNFGNGKIRGRLPVHKLQAYQKFGLDAFKKDVHIRHLNGNSLDNSWDNIGIGTCQENSMDKSYEARMKSALAATAKVRRFTDAELTELFNDRFVEKLKYSELMVKYNISSKGTLSFILNHSLFASSYRDRNLPVYAN